MHIIRLCAALAALTPWLPCAAAPAAPAVEPVLRGSESLDSRRLGRVSEDERALLRVEWRAGLTAQAEAQTVQDLLDSLRRMEATVGEIGRLLRAMPAPQAPAPAVEATDGGHDELRLVLAGLVVVMLLALWWQRRRNTVRHPATAAARATAPAPAAPPLPPPIVAAEAPRLAVAPAPTPVASDAAPPPVGEAPVIDFLLEDADPQWVARQNVKPPPSAAGALPRFPRIAQETSAEPTLELAEIMLSMGLAQGAAQALVEYSEANPRQALYHWLKLLDIYRSGGHSQDFKETAEKLRQHFNIQAADWARDDSGAEPTLENFARVLQHVQQLWSQPADGIAYLRHLLEDNREGERAGFPRPVAEEILLLIEILKETAGAAQAVAE